jgi:prepilin-type N-terminal cleavage/methylation domain-containing protein
MRRGFTLLELVLVLSIIVMVSALAIPTYQAYISSREIAGSAGRLELEIRKARLEAIRTGQIQKMEVKIGGREVSLQPWLSADDSASASGGATVVTQVGQVITTDANGMAVSSNGVPATTWSVGQSVTFENAQIFTDVRSVVQTGTMTSGPVGDVSSPIFFYPDGSSSTARIVLTNTRGRRIAVEVRGVTGATTIVELVPNLGSKPS